jgi:hypothetical protein
VPEEPDRAIAATGNPSAPDAGTAEAGEGAIAAVEPAAESRDAGPASPPKEIEEDAQAKNPPPPEPPKPRPPKPPVSPPPAPKPPAPKMPAEKVAVAPQPPPGGGTGTLRINSEPFAVVYLGAKKLGPTPQMDLKLPVGSHTLTLKNDALGITKKIRVIIEKDKVHTVFVDLNQK